MCRLCMTKIFVPHVRATIPTSATTATNWGNNVNTYILSMLTDFLSAKALLILIVDSDNKHHGGVKTNRDGGTVD